MQHTFISSQYDNKEAARRERDELYNFNKKLGRQVKRWTLKNQIVLGTWATVYVLDIAPTQEEVKDSVHKMLGDIEPRKESKMDYTNSSNLTTKSQAATSSCSAFIRNELMQIPQGQGIAMIDLCTVVTEKFEGVRDKRQGYVRIGNVLKRNGMSDLFERKVDDSGYTHICRKGTNVAQDEKDFAEYTEAIKDELEEQSLENTALTDPEDV